MTLETELQKLLGVKDFQIVALQIELAKLKAELEEAKKAPQPSA